MKNFSMVKPTALIIALLTTCYPLASFAQGENGALGQKKDSYASMAPMYANKGDHISWNSESSYWRNNYATRPYYNSSRNYSVYEPAYRYGADMYSRNNGRSYNELDQEELRKGWEQARGNSNLKWNDAKMATRDAYDRMYNNNSANTGRYSNMRN